MKQTPFDRTQAAPAEAFLYDKHPQVVSYDQGVDQAAYLVAAHVDDEPVDPIEARRIRRKLDRAILPLLFAIYTDSTCRTTLGASAVLGLIEENDLTADQFNTLGSAFYIGYIVFEYPHSLALQRFPVAKYLAATIFLWSLILGLHCVCKDFGGLFALRFLLGAAEGSISNGAMVATSMFYNRTEIGERLGWTLQCNGLGSILSGFLAYGVAHLKSNRRVAQWQLFMIINAGLTFLIGIWFLLVFPDSPVTARFLTQDEKVAAVRRIRSNQSGTETKTWKREQMVEALEDLKTWLFFLFAAVSNLQNGFGTQYSLIIKSFGFTTVETTALGVPLGAAQIVSITTSTILLRRFPNSRCWLAMVFFVPSEVSVILQITLPWSNRVGLLCSFYVMNFGGAPSWAMIVSLVAVTISGHTKKLTVNAIFLIGYSLGQTLCTQFWKEEYKPRNYVPYGIILGSYLEDYVLLIAILYVLSRENRRRDLLMTSNSSEDDYGFIVKGNSDGSTSRQKVDKAMLDLTDKQNPQFRYAL